MPSCALNFGTRTASIEVAAGSLLRSQAIETPTALPDPASAIRAVLQAPTDFPPLHRIFTPDDEVAVALDPQVPRLVDLLPVVVEEILRAGVGQEQITLVLPPETPGDFETSKVLPVALQGVTLCRHDRHLRQELAYFAATRGGRAAYLNRHLVDAGQTVVLNEVTYDPVSGFQGGLEFLYPLMADAAAWQDHTLHANATLLGRRDTPAAALATEVGWLLGLPFLIQVLPGEGETISHVFAGTAESLGDRPLRQLDRQRRLQVSRSAEVVLASVARPSMAAITRAYLVASRVVRPGGSIVVLFDGTGMPGPALELLREVNTPVEALAKGKSRDLSDRLQLWELAVAAQHARLFLLSQMPNATVEDLQLTPLESLTEVQRLIDQAQSTLLLPEADRCLIELTKG